MPIIAGNWKMNNNIKESIDLIKKIKKNKLDENVETVVCVPYLSIQDVSKELEDTNIKVGAQNMHWEESGAYTGEISPLMLKELNIDYVILGHSERRQYFNETDESINKKMKSAISNNINPIICVGESLEEKEAGKEKLVVKNQIIEGFKDIPKDKLENIVIAYEPIWAIGTGKTASAEDANKMCGYIRNVISEIYSKNESDRIRIQYGGSVNPNNVKELMEKSDIDGALVGGASLKADDFIKLVNY